MFTDDLKQMQTSQKTFTTDGERSESSDFDLTAAALEIFLFYHRYYIVIITICLHSYI